MRIYISGKADDLFENTEKHFLEAERKLRKMFPKVKVINPKKLEPCLKSVGWAEYMEMFFSMMMESEAVFMLEGWEDSKRARIEKEYAAVSDKIILYESMLFPRKTEKPTP